MTKTIKLLASVPAHLPFLTTLKSSGMAERNGLSIELSVAKTREQMKDRAKLLLNGQYEFLSGLHHDPYFMRAEGEYRLTYLAQTQSFWDDRLLGSPDVTNLKKLEGKRILVGTTVPCVFGNLKALLQLAGVKIESIDFVIREMGLHGYEGGKFNDAIGALENQEVQAALVDMPFDLQGTKRGFKLLELPKRPIVHNTTIVASSDYINENEETVMVFLRSIVMSLYFFKNKPEETINILQREATQSIGIEEKDEIEHLYNGWRQLLQDKPYPLPEGIQNVFSLDFANNPVADKVNPLEPWDLHYLRKLLDSDPSLCG